MARAAGDSFDLPSPSSCDSDSSCAPPVTVPEEVNNTAKCTMRLAQLYDSPKFSDVTLCVDTHKFHAHKLLLANSSDVFEQMLFSENWVDAGRRELILQEQDDCIPVFGDFLKYLYTGQIRLNTDTVLGLLVLADKYNVPDLKDCCSAYMSQHLVSAPDENKAITWYQYAIACNSQDLQEACFNFILLNMDIVIQSPDWIYMDKENLVALLRMSEMVIESEYVLLQALVRWLSEETHRIQQVEGNLKLMLPHIRFPMILPEHLAKFEESKFQKDHHEYFSQYLLLAYRHHALSIRDKNHITDVSNSQMQFRYRNYTDENYSICADVVRRAYRSCPRVSSKVEKPLSLPMNICNTAQDRQVKMKVTFFPQGYYTTSLWNGQLNLAKSSDLTKLVIAHRGGVQVHESQITAVLYNHHGGIRFAEKAVSADHAFECYGSFEIENLVDLEKLKADNSTYILDGACYLKVFVRGLRFHNPMGP